MKLPKGVKELSLKPYPGRLFLAANRKSYEEACRVLLKTEDKLDANITGRFLTGPGKNRISTSIIWASNTAVLAHEISHVLLYTFDICGIDPRQAGGEPFCYMLSQLLLDAGIKR